MKSRLCGAASGRTLPLAVLVEPGVLQDAPWPSWDFSPSYPYRSCGVKHRDINGVTRSLRVDQVWGPLLPERRLIALPLAEQLRQRARLDRPAQPRGAAVALDRRVRPLELVRVQPADEIDHEERGRKRPVGVAVRQDEANAVQQLAGILVR